MISPDFPVMVGVSLRSVDAVLLLFSVTNRDSYDQVQRD